uniref:Sulfotransferase n=1 Tax=Schlesneria paludicola TaxID=360056 RepID=A0A7C4QMN5_9PLAN
MFEAVCFSAGIRWRILTATLTVLGPGREFWHQAAEILPFEMILRCLFRLDGLFDPLLRQQKVDRPVFIVAHPRSGTTFLHRLLTEAGDFVAFPARDIALPSPVARRLLGRLVEWRLRHTRLMFPKQVGHEVTLDSIEEEELLFTHTDNTQFLALLTPLAFSDWDFAPLVYGDEQSPAVQRRAIEFFRECLKRQIRRVGKSRVVAKLNYSIMRMRSLLAAFPDARVVYVVRSPLETIRSHLSLHRNMLNHQWMLDDLPSNRVRRYFQRRYRYDVELYRYMEDLIDQQVIPDSQLLVLPYERLRSAPSAAVREIADFADLSLSAAAWERIRAQDGWQTAYQPPHRHHALEDFGLTAEKVVRDLEFVFDKYGFPKEVDVPKEQVPVA